MSLPWFVFWSTFPDLLSFSPEVISAIWFRLFGPGYGRIHPFQVLGLDVYNLGHSLVVFVPVFAAAWLVLRGRAWPLLGWALHIGIDMGSHPAQYPILFLWPVSAFPAHGISWRKPLFLVLNYTALATVFLLLRRFRKRAPGAADCRSGVPGL